MSARDRTEQALSKIADPKGEGARACLTVYAEAARAAADAADARVKAGKATINGISIADRKKNLELAREIVAFRTSTTVDAINKAIANKGTLPAPPRAPR